MKLWRIVATSGCMLLFGCGHVTPVKRITWGTPTNYDEVMEPRTASAGEGDDFECEYVTALGTRIPQKICTTALERREQKENAQRFIRRAQGRVNPGIAP